MRVERAYAKREGSESAVAEVERIVDERAIVRASYALPAIAWHSRERHKCALRPARPVSQVLRNDLRATSNRKMSRSGDAPSVRSFQVSVSSLGYFLGSGEREREIVHRARLSCVFNPYNGRYDIEDRRAR